jgi:hypothetical protein
MILTLLYNKSLSKPITIISERQLLLNDQIKFFIRSYDKFLVKNIIVDDNKKIDILQSKSIVNYILKSASSELSGYSVFIEDYKLPIKTLFKINLNYIYKPYLIDSTKKSTYLQKTYFSLQYSNRSAFFRTNFTRFLTQKNFISPYFSGFILFQKHAAFSKKQYTLLNKLKQWRKNLKIISLTELVFIRKILLYRLSRYDYLNSKCRLIKIKRKKFRKFRSLKARQSRKYKRIDKKTTRYGIRNYVGLLR